MSTSWIFVIVLLLILPPQSLSDSVKTTCEIASVEAGNNATLTIHFGHDLTHEEQIYFIVTHFAHNASASQEMLSCLFTNGDVKCDNKTCCTWERKVTDVFRVYIHNVSQELEGRFWGFVIPADKTEQKYCNFTLKDPTCLTDSINTTNGQVICNNHPVTIGQSCRVTCSPGQYFQENKTFVTYTCIGKNKWTPEIPVTACEEQPKELESHVHIIIPTLFGALITIVALLIVFMCKKRHRERRKRSNKEEQPLLSTGPKHVQTEQQEAEKYWLDCIKVWYPELQSRSYFFPSLDYNQAPNSEIVDRCLEQMPPVPQDSDVFGDRALERVLQCLQTLADNSEHSGTSQQTDNSQEIGNPQQTDNSKQIDNPLQTDNSKQIDNPRQKEVMMVISQLQFGKYLRKPSYAAAVVLLSQYDAQPEEFQHYDTGDCDILIIHRTLGLLTLQITSVGGNFSQLKMAEKRKDEEVVRKVTEAVIQLNKAETVLQHLTADIPAIKHITKILVLPNVSSSQLLRAINRTPVVQMLCQCLGVQSVDDAVKLCLLSDQLSVSNSLEGVREWWQHIVKASEPMTPSIYEQSVARFCGSATTVEVHCVTAPRLNIRILGKAVSESGESVARLALFPKQVDILNHSPPRLFVSGEPGTGKTIVLTMQGLTWMNRGYDVHVVSTWDESRAVTFLIEHQLQETAKSSTATSRVHRHQFNFEKDEELETAIGSLKSMSDGRQLCVIADDVVYDHSKRTLITKFCDQLIVQVPEVYVWAASEHHDARPLCLEEVKFTTPLRSPPVIFRKMLKSGEINKRIPKYTRHDVPVLTDGPPVKRIRKHHVAQRNSRRSMPIHRINHGGIQSAQAGVWQLDSIKCGRKIAHVLTELKVGQTCIGDSNDPPPLQYRDVLVLCAFYPTDDRVDSNGQVTTTASGLVRGLRDRHVPVRVVEKGDEAAIRDTALGVGDLVIVANLKDVHGLERKVVVMESRFGYDKFYSLSRCTSQLVLIDC